MPTQKKETVKNSVLVKGGILKWARESIGFSIDKLGQATKIDAALLKKWESGDSEIVISLLIREKHRDICSRISAPAYGLPAQEPPERAVLFRARHLTF